MQRILILSLIFAISLFTACKKQPQHNANFKRTSNAVIVRMDGDADRLNPFLVVTNYGRVVVENIFMYLLAYEPNDLSLTTDLAVARPVVQDVASGPYAGGVSYTFEILPEAVWDNGQPVTGTDYLFSVKALLNPMVQAAAVRAYLTDLADVQVDPSNPKKFTVIMRQKSIFGEETAGGLFSILPEYLFDPKGLLKNIPLSALTDPELAEALAKEEPRLQDFAESFNSDPYSRDPALLKGCGPYELVSWETGQRIVLRKKANWWGDRLAKNRPTFQVFPDSLIFKPIPNPATALAALQNEEIDAMSNLAPEDFLRLQEDSAFNQLYQLGTVDGLAYYYIGVNARRPLLSDKRVRQALAHVVDADEIIREVFQGFGQRIAAPVPLSVDYYPKALKPIPFNLEKAKSLLAQAGWKDTDNNGIVDKTVDGKKTDLKLTYLLNASSETSRNIGLLIQDNARKAGIDLQLEAKEPTVLLDQLKKGDFELVSAGRTQSPLWNPMQNWHTQGDNRYGFGDAETDALIEDILVTMDDKARREKMIRLLNRIYDEQVEILLFAPKDRIAIHKRFETTLTPFTPGFTPSQFKLKE
ncbi:MAG: hypothetical protein IPK21_13175 [Haliscomenobacter sp.]|nr:hypothetical protein [Haliscomenobacter sp.]